MILRTWHGRTLVRDADAYEAFLKARAAPDYSSTPGFRGSFFSRRDEGEIAHFLLATIWRDIDSVRAFAGADPTRAKYYPEDDRFLLEQETVSLNHEVFYQGHGEG